jgi:hypothetical protein
MSQYVKATVGTLVKVRDYWGPLPQYRMDMPARIIKMNTVAGPQDFVTVEYADGKRYRLPVRILRAVER